MNDGAFLPFCNILHPILFLSISAILFAVDNFFANFFIISAKKMRFSLMIMAMAVSARNYCWEIQYDYPSPGAYSLEQWAGNECLDNSLIPKDAIAL
jgi:hypothetical protein